MFDVSVHSLPKIAHQVAPKERAGMSPKDFVRDQLKRLGKNQNWLADCLELSPPALSQLLGGNRELKVREADKLAELLNVDLLKLMEVFGANSPTGPHLPRHRPKLFLSGYIGEKATVFPLSANPERYADPSSAEIEAPRGMPPGEAFEILSESLRPRYLPGELIFTDTSQGTDPADFIGLECVVNCSDGRRLLRIVQECPIPGRFALVSHSSSLEPACEVTAAAPVVWHRPQSREPR